MKGTTIANMFNGNTRFIVPVYQRWYSWKTKQVEQFLDDLEDVNDEAEEHFFGYVLTTLSKNGQTKIIDGQQRMTTATLFLICARNFYYSQGEEELVKAVEKPIYATKNGVDRDYNEPILVPGLANQELFLDILERRLIEDELNPRYTQKNGSNIQLSKAYKTIQKWFLEKKEEANATTEIQKLEHTLLTKFRIVEHECTDEREANRVFDLVNHRGIQLRDSDLVKNQLFGIMASENGGESEIEINRCDVIWNEMRNHITNSETSYDLDNFFAHYLGGIKNIKLTSSRKTYDRFDELIRDPKTKEWDVEAVKNLIDELLGWSWILNDLRSPADKKEFKKYADLVHYLKKIKEIDAKLVYTPIFAGYSKYWDKKKYMEFEALVVLCYKLHVRLKDVLGGRDSVVRTVMHEITTLINDGVGVKQIIDQMAEHKKYHSDDHVRNRLENESISSANVALALLEEAEYAHTRHRIGGDVTLEHIMPQTIAGSAGDKWVNYIIEHNDIDDTNEQEAVKKAKEIQERYLDRLGNQTLLTKTENPSVGNCIFEEKVEVYKKSKYKITREINGEEPWTVNSIEERQKILARGIVDELDLRRIITKKV